MRVVENLSCQERSEKYSKGAGRSGAGGRGKATFLACRSIARKYSRHWEQLQDCEHNNNLNDTSNILKHSYMLFHLITQEGVVQESSVLENLSG